MTTPLFISKRNQFYHKISGKGLEIGAFEHPACLPENCEVVYCDVISNEEAKAFFPEVNHTSLVSVDQIIDLDHEGLKIFEDRSQDFVIINHVIEHLFDPISAIVECFRVLRPNGFLILSVPDKRFTFDCNRPLTSNQDIFERVKRIPKEPNPVDYFDMLQFVHPELLDESAEVKEDALKGFHRRREHLNIWTDQSFLSFIDEVLHQKKIKSILTNKVLSNENQFEFFGIWKKLL